MSYNWRTQYFNKSLCNGIITQNQDGNVTIKGKLNNNRNGKLLYWAANPAEMKDGFTGSGLPYPSPSQAFENSNNIGTIETDNGEFNITIDYPNSYYVGLGTLYIPPHIYLKYCDEDEIVSIKLGEGIPYRTLTHPAPPSKNFRLSPTFYNNSQLYVRTQEQILRDSAYPEYNVIPDKIPDNFWGLRPPR